MKALRVLRSSVFASLIALAGCPGGGSSSLDAGLDAVALADGGGTPTDGAAPAEMGLDAAASDAAPSDAAPVDAIFGDAELVSDAGSDAAPDAAADMGVVLGACCTIDARCDLASEARCAALGGRLTVNQTCEAVACAAPTRQQMVEHAIALEGVVRASVGLYSDVVGTVGREFWNLNGDAPEYTGALLGQGAVAPDSRFVVGNYRALYRVVRHGLQLERMAEVVVDLTPRERSATVGFAVTMQAYAVLLVANLFGDNGVLPVEALDDPANARFLAHQAALTHVADLLDRAAMALSDGGAAFPFGVSHGFDRFDQPATFRQFNRALSARVRLYQGDPAGAISGVAGSFFNINGDLATGPRHGFSAADRNPLFHAPDVDLYTVHPQLAAIRGDQRISRRTRPYDPQRVGRLPVTLDGLAGDHQLALVAFDTDPWPIIRNEELILIYAEAQVGASVNEVLAALNRVRNGAGLGNYAGAVDDASLRAEVRAQRARSLLGEGHRWIDMRRAGRLAELPIDRRRDAVIDFLPRPDVAALGDL